MIPTPTTVEVVVGSKQTLKGKSEIRPRILRFEIAHLECLATDQLPPSAKVRVFQSEADKPLLVSVTTFDDGKEQVALYSNARCLVVRKGFRRDKICWHDSHVSTLLPVLQHARLLRATDATFHRKFIAEWDAFVHRHDELRDLQRTLNKYGLQLTNAQVKRIPQELRNAALGSATPLHNFEAFKGMIGAYAIP